jgi:hypothetical protein
MTNRGYINICHVGRFFFNTPYTPGGKARGELHEQWMRRTVLSTGKCFPYVKRRLEVTNTIKIELNPLEVAILNMTSKINEMKTVLNRTPCDSKLLQMQLQGGIATAVNQVGCVSHSAPCYVCPSPSLRVRSL